MDYLKNIYKNIDPSKKYVNTNNKNLYDIKNDINSKKYWTVNSCKKITNDLYNLKKKLYNSDLETNQNIKEIDFWLSYVHNQLDDITDYHSNIFTLISTIFVVFSFIVGYFGMNFNSMYKHHGFFTIKYSTFKLNIFLLIISFFIISFYFGLLNPI